jgi:dihydrofolate reductase
MKQWADRLNGIQKYVFSSKLEKADWSNSTIVRGDVVAEVTKLEQQEGANLLIYGHGLLAQTLLKERLLRRAGYFDPSPFCGARQAVVPGGRKTPN